MDELRCITCRRPRRNLPSIELSVKALCEGLPTAEFDRQVTLQARLIANALEVGHLCHDCAKSRCITSFSTLIGGPGHG